MQTDLKAMSLRDFRFGIDMFSDPKALDPRYVQDGRNILFDEIPGKVVSRPGSGLLTTLTGDVAILRQYVYTKSNGNSYHIVQLSNFKVYSSADLTTYTEITPTAGGGGGAKSFDALCCFATFEDMLWISSKSASIPVAIFDGTTGWFLDGGTYTAGVGVTVPAGTTSPWKTPTVPKGSIIQLGPDGNSLWIGNTTNNPSEVRFSRYYDDSGNDIYAYDEDAWPAANQLAIAQDDGTELRALHPYHGNMIAGKKLSIYLITGSNPLYYAIEKVSDETGIISHFALAEYMNMVIFLGKGGLWAYAGGTLKMISEKMQPFFDTCQQLLANQMSCLHTTTADWNTGTPNSAVIDTSLDELKQLPQTSQADWSAGTLTDVEATSSPGDVKLTTAILTDLANGKAATASLSYDTGYTADKAVDGSDSTYWMGGYAGSPSVFDAWWQVDLGSEKSITQIFTKMTLNTPYSAKIQYSTNGSSWTDVVASLVSGDVVSNFSTITARYFRIYFTSNGTPANNSACLYAFEAYTSTTGNIITQSINYGYTPTSMGNLAAGTTLPTGTTMNFQTRTSADGATWSAWADIGGAGENGGAINSPAAQYLQWKAIFNKYRTTTPVLSSGYVGARWRSAVQTLSAVPTVWGNFEVDYNAAGQTCTFWMRSGSSGANCLGASWTQQTPGTAITVTKAQYIQIEVRFNTTSASAIPEVYAIIANYFKGSSNIQEAHAVVYNQRFLLTCASGNGSSNDSVIGLSLREVTGNTPVFTQFSGWNISSFCLWGSDLLGGSSTDGDLFKLWTGTSDAGTAIDAWFTTKDLDFKLADNQKLLRQLYISASPTIDSDLKLVISFDVQTERTIALSTLKDIEHNVPYSCPPGWKGKICRIKFQCDTLNQKLEAVGIEIYYRVLPLRKLVSVTQIGGDIVVATWTTATRPTNPYLFQTGRNTDFDGEEVYIGSGQWRIIWGTWRTETRPSTTNLAPGSRGFNEDPGMGQESWDGTQWTAQ